MEYFDYSSPFLDYELIDFILRLPLKFRKNQYLYRKMLIKYYPEIFRLPTKANFGLPLLQSNQLRIIKMKMIRIVNEIFTRLFKKSIFQNKMNNYIDYSNLLRTNDEFRDEIYCLIQRAISRKIFDGDTIHKLWELHMAGKKNLFSLFNILATIELLIEQDV